MTETIEKSLVLLTKQYLQMRRFEDGLKAAGLTVGVEFHKAMNQPEIMSMLVFGDYRATEENYRILEYIASKNPADDEDIRIYLFSRLKFGVDSTAQA